MVCNLTKKIPFTMFPLFDKKSEVLYDATVYIAEFIFSYCPLSLCYAIVSKNSQANSKIFLGVFGQILILGVYSGKNIH